MLLYQVVTITKFENDPRALDQRVYTYYTMYIIYLGITPFLKKQELVTSLLRVGFLDLVYSVQSGLSLATTCTT